MTEEHTLTVGDGESTREMLDDITRLYVEVHAEPDQASGSLYGRDAFVTRTRNQTNREGFSIVYARDRGAGLVGFSFGVPLGPGQWWTGEASPPPDTILAATKFAVIELIVKKDWRGRGLGRRLLDHLLRDRPEPYAILTARSNTPARTIYARWGWQQVGTAQHTLDAPIMDQLVLPMTANQGASDHESRI